MAVGGWASWGRGRSIRELRRRISRRLPEKHLSLSLVAFLEVKKSLDGSEIYCNITTTLWSWQLGRLPPSTSTPCVKPTAGRKRLAWSSHWRRHSPSVITSFVPAAVLTHSLDLLRACPQEYNVAPTYAHARNGHTHTHTHWRLLLARWHYTQPDLQFIFIKREIL